MFGGNSKTVLVLVRELNLDVHLIQNDMRYPGIMRASIHNPTKHQRKKIPLSFHYRLRHYILMALSHHLLSNANLLAIVYIYFHRLADKIPHQDIHPLNYESLYRYGLQQDTLSCLGTSLHSKMCSLTH